MKTLVPFLFLSFSFLFIQCSSTQFVKNPEFNITNATYHSWTGGQPGTGGINVKIEVENASITAKQKPRTLEVELRCFTCFICNVSIIY